MKKLFSIFLFFPIIVLSQNFTKSFVSNQTNFSCDSSDINISLKPIFYSHLADDIGSITMNDSHFYAYGTLLNARVSSKLYFTSRIFNVAGNFNNALSNYIDSLGVFPEMNQIDSKISYFSYSANYNISKFFSTEFGNGTHFIGNGYRSMLLSNNHTPYPYLSFTTNLWKVKYYNLFTTFSDIYSADMSQKKHGAFHYLDYEPNKRLTIGIFEGIIWQAQDENYDRGYDLHYLNPIIFYRPVEFSKHSPDNALLGLNVNYDLKNISFYSQVVLDDINLDRHDNSAGGFFQNKYAIQIGSKINFNVNQHKFDLLTEYNKAQPYTYAHKHPLQNYTHMNQALAHPLGANFKEKVFLLSHVFNKWATKIKYTHAVYGADSANTHYGQNIFISDFLAQGEGGEYSYGNYNGQGLKTNLHTFYSELSYNLKEVSFFLAYYLRKKSTEIDSSNYLIFGVKTDLINPFLDF